MTAEDIVAHWQNGAQEALRTAEWNMESGMHELALFHAHLALEKALKSVYISQHKEDHPYTHDLLRIALLIRSDWDDETKEAFSHLSDYAVAARYSDPVWALSQANAENAKCWVAFSKKLLSQLLP